jgi:hypothetical protein
VHPAADLEELLRSVAEGPAQVRKTLGAEELNYGLWVSAEALAQSRREDHRRLLVALQSNGIRVSTMNAFPLGNFHAEVVKYDVYKPNWTDPRRAQYTLECAELLEMLLPEDEDWGSISTLPLGFRDAFVTPESVRAACTALCDVALKLEARARASGKSIRICLEPEPGCALESSADFIAFWTGPLSERAAELGADDAMSNHLGICIDTCHHALAFEDASTLLQSLQAAAIPIGKIQLSSAASLNPALPDAFSAMQSLDEARFLHQVRTRGSDGHVTGCDDLGEVADLSRSAEWRVHFHLPIYEASFGSLGSTQAFLNQIMAALPTLSSMPHLEIETYTWNVLPEGRRPDSKMELAECIANEWRYAEERLA